MLKRLINKIMKIKYVDSEGVERYETYKEWQERITKVCDMGLLYQKGVVRNEQILCYEK